MTRTMKIDILGAFFAGLCTLAYVGCENESILRGGIYSTNLEECNRKAKNLCESIDCENHYRRAEGRLPREIPAHCFPAIKDGGIE